MTDLEDQYAEFRGDAGDWPSDRDFGIGILRINEGRPLNVDAQLAAVSEIQELQRATKNRRTEAIKNLEALARGAKAADTNEHFVSEWLWELEAGTYEDAAHSMAIVGMLAPLVESIFFRAFLYMGEKHSESAWELSTHERWAKNSRRRWDCHYIKDLSQDDKNIVRGIGELADATGLATYLPATLRTTLEALFQYRNKMFHNGLEWPERELEKFSVTSAQRNGWFSMATINRMPAFFYATSKFADDCIGMINHSLEGLGKYARMHMFK